MDIMRRSLVVCLFAFAVGALDLGIWAQSGAEKPAFERAPDALERVSWRTRTLVGDERLTAWRFAVPAAGAGVSTFLEAIVRADAAGVSFVEGSSVQKTAPDIPKNLDHTLMPDEMATVRGRMGNVRMVSYRIDSLGDAGAQRRTFELAKAMGADTIVTRTTSGIGGLDTLANEFGVNVALLSSDARPARLVKELQGRSKRLGVGIDTGLWAQEGLSTREAIAAVKERLLYVSLRDRSDRGAAARNVLLGRGAANLVEFFHELNRLGVRPLVMTLDTAGVVDAPGDLFPAIDAFEAAVQPAYGVNFTAFSKTRPTRWDLVTPARGETLSPEAIRKGTEEARQKIVAAIPKQAHAAPKKPRKLLVLESLHGMSHDTIPHTNVMLEQMGKITGAWETEFNNDLENLKYPKIKKYDAVFLNSTVGEMLPDPAVRDGLARFVREGGGLGGVHGTPWASRNWDEFAEIIGAQSAPHRIEQGVMKVHDPSSPIVKPFGGKDFGFREEYYRFEHEGRGRLRWDNVRVLLTVDLDDPKIEPRPWNGYKRPDRIYPVTWIRTYGKGRVFYSSLGHMPETFMSPQIVGHFLAGLQFVLGDLEADATPNPRQAAPTSTPAAQPAAPQVPSISRRPNGSSLSTIRAGAGDSTIWFGWRVAMPATAVKPLTFSEALAVADINGLVGVEASSTQIVSPEVPKHLDHRLQAGERNAVNYRLRELNQQILAYRADSIGSDASARRKVFELAKTLNVPTIIVNADTSSLAELDTLAEEFGIGVAVESRRDPKQTMAALDGRSRRIGVAADLGGWVQAGVTPVDGLAIVKDRLMVVSVAPLGAGAATLGDFFLTAYRAGVKPLSIAIQPGGPTEADLVKSLNAFEQVMWPAMAERVRRMVDSPPGQIRGPERLTTEERRRIEAAAPREAIVKPRKPRRMLVTDLQMYSGHTTIPHGNLLLELIAKNTGAFEPIFSNDLNLLKYPKIKEFDAIYLNNVCGMVHNDPDVREGILRFVREGGGIGGHHAVTYANNNWPEFAEMMGGWAGEHRIEKQIVKIDDPRSPLTKSFGSASFEHTDEFYHFPPSSPYSREKQHVLLSIDVEKSDRANGNRFCVLCTRPDQDYGLAWIRTYGKGRAYFTPLGHTDIFYTDERWTQHLLAAIQYMLGDLDADATPSAKLSKRVSQ
jgi:type 1 glutamine amidotransferase/sugar phosphate isomerase/epimerase